MIVETYSPLSLFRCCSTGTVFYSSGGLSPIASCNSFFPISILSFCGRSGHSTYSNLFPISRISINILLISQLKVLDSAAEKSFSGKLRRLCSLFLSVRFLINWMCCNFAARFCLPESMTDNGFSLYLYLKPNFPSYFFAHHCRMC